MTQPNPLPLAEPAIETVARPWLIAGTLCLPNLMLKALWQHIRTVCLTESDWPIDNPYSLSDCITEWLSTEGSIFKGARVEAVILLPLQMGEVEGLGIYYRNTNIVDLVTVAGIVFRENAEQAWLTGKPLN